MFDARQALAFGGTIAGELVRDQHARDIRTAREYLAEELLGSGFVAAALNQDIQDVAVLIDRPPQVVLLSIRSRILILLSNTHALDLARF